jgi:hypothetical protein
MGRFPDRKGLVPIDPNATEEGLGRLILDIVWRECFRDPKRGTNNYRAWLILPLVSKRYARAPLTEFLSREEDDLSRGPGYVYASVALGLLVMQPLSNFAEEVWFSIDQPKAYGDMMTTIVVSEPVIYEYYEHRVSKRVRVVIESRLELPYPYGIRMRDGNDPGTFYKFSPSGSYPLERDFQPKGKSIDFQSRCSESREVGGWDYDFRSVKRVKWAFEPFLKIDVMNIIRKFHSMVAQLKAIFAIPYIAKEISQHDSMRPMVVHSYDWRNFVAPKQNSLPFDTL